MYSFFVSLTYKCSKYPIEIHYFLETAFSENFWINVKVYLLNDSVLGPLSSENQKHFVRSNEFLLLLSWKWMAQFIPCCSILSNFHCY